MRRCWRAAGSVDSRHAGRRSDGADHPGLRQIAFTIGVIALGAKMARRRWRGVGDEVEAFRDFFQVPPGEESNVERFFNLAKRDVAGFETYARQLAALFPDAPEILENVLEGLFGIAKADGPVDVAEAAYLAEVSSLFGLSSARFERAKAAALGVVECEPCTILGIDPLATDEQIREAWLRQVKAQPSRPADGAGPARGGHRHGQPQARADQRRLRPAAPRARPGPCLTWPA